MVFQANINPSRAGEQGGTEGYGDTGTHGHRDTAEPFLAAGDEN